MSDAILHTVHTEDVHTTKATPEEMLEQYDDFIQKQVRELVRQHSAIARPGVLDLEIDELIQRVRIKFWNALREKEILYPRAYLRQIARRDLIDYLRSRKPTYELPLPEDMDGEIYQGNMLITPGISMSDPADVYEQQQDEVARLDEIMNVTLRLPRRQRHALICTLRERIDNPAVLELAFKTRALDLASWQWPSSRGRALLRASLTYARAKVSKEMHDSTYIQAAYLTHRSRKACGLP